MRIYAFSEHFVSSLASYSGGFLPGNSVELFLKTAELEMKNHYFTYSSESNLLRIISSMFDKVSFINECITYPHYIEILMLIAVNSNYLSDILVRNPEYFYWIMNPRNLTYKPGMENFRDSVEQALSPYHSFNAKVNTLRRIKRKEILRIGVNDLLGNSSLEEVTLGLAVVAKTLCATLFDLCYQEVLQKYNIEKVKNSFVLAALGKLGGNELNYSSDVDLLLFFSKNSKIKNKEYFELLTETAYLFIDNCSRITDTGYLYRVDFRLRPDGRNSLLCRTIGDYLAYYESRGEDWERQMLIKASFCAGDESLYNSFINYLQPFIYPASFIIPPADQIRKLKNNIEKNLKSEENIKLVPGGIRDIEFSVQALQLLNGGADKNIRSGTTLTAIKKLSDAGLLNNNEKDIFTEAYTIFRRIEHFLQLMNDKQTHTIPAEGELLEKLTFFLEFKTPQEFNDKFISLKKGVRNIYNSITGGEIEEVIAGDNIPFQNRKKAEGDLSFLSTGKGLLAEKSFEKSTTDAFSNIESNLLHYLKNSPDPDKTLRNFSRVIKDVNFPAQWYRAFSDKKFFNDFLYLCTYSQRSVDIFAEDAELREFFLSKNVFEKITRDKYQSVGIKKLLFIVSVQYMLGLIDEKDLSTYICRAINSRIAELSSEIIKIKVPYVIAAAGSLGSEEMNFSSDIDLIFITSGEKNILDLQKTFQLLLNKIKSELKPFDADCRLRPEGKNSYLVWDIDVYKKYILERSRVWELQSLSKLKYITGDKSIITDLNKSVISRIKKENRENIANEILQMRKKLYPSGGLLQQDVVNIKKDKGGFLDIEFLMQYLMLLKPELYKKLQGANYTKILRALSSEFKLPELEEILLNYKFLKNLLLSNQCIFSSTGYNVTVNKETIPLFQYSERVTAENIKEKLSGTLKFNNFQFNKITGNKY